jgi:hypothetical protein
MTEPVYEYRKGVGWVPTVERSYSGVIGKYLVICIDRKPEVGEYYFTGRADLVFSDLHRFGWPEYFKLKTAALHRHMNIYQAGGWMSSGPVTTIRLEYLGPQSSV